MIARAMTPRAGIPPLVGMQKLKIFSFCPLQNPAITRLRYKDKRIIAAALSNYAPLHYDALNFIFRKPGNFTRHFYA